jgi:hypothetical protein
MSLWIVDDRIREIELGPVGALVVAGVLFALGFMIGAVFF